MDSVTWTSSPSQLPLLTGPGLTPPFLAWQGRGGPLLHCQVWSWALVLAQSSGPSGETGPRVPWENSGDSCEIPGKVGELGNPTHRRGSHDADRAQDRQPGGALQDQPPCTVPLPAGRSSPSIFRGQSRGRQAGCEGPRAGGLESEQQSRGRGRCALCVVRTAKAGPRTGPGVRREICLLLDCVMGSPVRSGLPS